MFKLLLLILCVCGVFSSIEMNARSIEQCNEFTPCYEYFLSPLNLTHYIVEWKLIDLKNHN